MKQFVAIVVLCLSAVSAATIEIQVLASPVKISTREVLVEVIDSNLALSEQANAAEVLSSIYSHFPTNQERAWAFTETYNYLGPDCIWSVAVNAESLHANKENGKTGSILLRATDTTTNNRASVAHFNVYSTPKNGATCMIP